MSIRQNNKVISSDITTDNYYTKTEIDNKIINPAIYITKTETYSGYTDPFGNSCEYFSKTTYSDGTWDMYADGIANDYMQYGWYKIQRDKLLLQGAITYTTSLSFTANQGYLMPEILYFKSFVTPWIFRSATNSFSGRAAVVPGDCFQSENYIVSWLYNASNIAFTINSGMIRWNLVTGRYIGSWNI